MPRNSVGDHYKNKINKVVAHLRKKSADFQFISASENNAWLFNIRGKELEYSPIPHSSVLIDKYKNIIFFCNVGKIKISLKNYFKEIKFIKTEFAPGYSIEDK